MGPRTRKQIHVLQSLSARAGIVHRRPGLSLFFTSLHSAPSRSNSVASSSIQGVFDLLLVGDHIQTAHALDQLLSSVI